MRGIGLLFQRRARLPRQYRFSSSRASLRERQEKERRIVRSTVKKVLISLAILACAIVIKQVDHPLTQAMRDNLSKSLNASTNMEDIAVFFSDISERYGEFREKAIAVFSDQSGKTGEEGEKTALSSEESTPIRDEYDGANPLIADLIFRSEIIPMQELTKPAPKKEPEAVVITQLYDVPESEADRMVDYDTGEVRGDWPYNVSNTLLLPFSIINPVEGPVSSPFGLRVNPVTKKEAFHYGIDIAAPKGTNILAVYEGTVKEVGRSVAYGNYIVISHPYEGETFYGHCSSILKKEGQTVKQGEAIAKVGSTGWSTGNHLHFEVRRDSYVLPPDKFVHLK